MSCDYLLRFSEDAKGTVVDSFSDEEKAILSKHVTNPSDNVFAYRQSEELSAEQIGAILSRYSRTSLNGRRLFLKEFYPNKTRGREFFDAWLADYGDDSIQEMAGGIPMACEFVSNLAVKDIEDCRLGSYIEKSTRYVQFDKKLPNGAYMYYRDPDIIASGAAERYIELMDGLFGAYSSAITPMEKYIADSNRIEDVAFRIGDRSIRITDADMGLEEQYGVSEKDLRKAYESAVKAAALDLLRDYLPMSTLTHVGISANARTYENMLNKLLSSPLAESRFIGSRMLAELRKLVPSLVRRVDDRHGRAFQSFISGRERESRSSAISLRSMPDPSFGVDLTEYLGMGTPDSDARAQVALASTIMYRYSNGASMREAVSAAEAMDITSRKGVISRYVGSRADRRHKPGRAFENLDYRFDIKCRIGIYRDMQRHRIGTHERQMFGTQLGYVMREEFEAIGIADDYRSRMEDVKDLYSRISGKLPYQAQYVVTLGFNIRWYYRLNARQLYHVCELRSSPQGHADYRKLVQAMAAQVGAVHPSVTEHMTYLNNSDKKLGRLDSEVRIAVKRAGVGGAAAHNGAK